MTNRTYRLSKRGLLYAQKDAFSGRQTRCMPVAKQMDFKLGVRPMVQVTGNGRGLVC